MKKLLPLIIFMSILSGCATGKKLPVDEGVGCATLKEKDKKKTCILVETFQDRTKWHFTRPWEEKTLGDMPDF